MFLRELGSLASQVVDKAIQRSKVWQRANFALDQTRKDAVL